MFDIHGSLQPSSRSEYINNQKSANQDLHVLFNSFFSYLDTNLVSSYMRIPAKMRFAFITKFISYSSSCVKAKQAALLVKDDRIISIGYNGPPQKQLNCLEYRDKAEIYCGKDSTGSCKHGIHAEQNAIAFAASNGISIKDSVMFVTQSPCINCAKLIAPSGISKVYYLEPYRLTEGLDYLASVGVLCEKFNL